MNRRYSLIVFVLLALAGIATGSTAARRANPPVVVNTAPVWVPVPTQQLSVGCQQSTAFEPVTYWPQNGETQYTLRAMVQGSGMVAIDVAGQGQASQTFNTGSQFEPIELIAHYTPPPDVPVMISVTLAGPSCPGTAVLNQPNIFAAP